MLSRKSHLHTGRCLDPKRSQQPTISPLKAFVSQESTDYGCVIIIVTENSIVASIIVLPKRAGGKGDTTQHTGIRPGGEATLFKSIEEDEDQDFGRIYGEHGDASQGSDTAS